MPDIILTDANAGDIVVTEGYCYIIDPSLTVDVNFINPVGTAVNFEVRFNDSNPNSITIAFENDPGMNASFVVANNVSLENVVIDAGNAASSTVTIGDNVTLGSYTGSTLGDDSVTAGDNFDLDDNLNLGDGTNSFIAGSDFNPDGSSININGGDGDNTFAIGANGQVNNITFGEGADNVSLGDGSSFNDLRTKGGADVVSLGDGATGNNIELGDGDDVLNIGEVSEDAFNDLRGGNENDTLNTVTDLTNDHVEFANNITDFEYFNFVCFAAGTLIKTSHGARPVEELRAGDSVLTLDNAYQPIRWIGFHRLNRDQLAANPKLRTICIPAGALGPGLPEQDLLVSPQHRILLRSKIAHRMFHSKEVLIPASKLIGFNGIKSLCDAETVEYWHFLFDSHQIVWSNGALTESLFTGPEAIKSVAPDARKEILSLFPYLADPKFQPIAARYIPTRGKLATRLVERHQKNNLPLVVLDAP